MEKTKLIVCTESQIEKILGRVVDARLKNHSIQSNSEITDGEVFLTRQQAADLLKISLPGLYPLIEEGKIIPIKLGGNIRFKKSQILEAIK